MRILVITYALLASLQAASITGGVDIGLNANPAVTHQCSTSTSNGTGSYSFSSSCQVWDGGNWLEGPEFSLTATYDSRSVAASAWYDSGAVDLNLPEQDIWMDAEVNLEYESSMYLTGGKGNATAAFELAGGSDLYAIAVVAGDTESAHGELLEFTDPVQFRFGEKLPIKFAFFGPMGFTGQASANWSFRLVGAAILDQGPGTQEGIQLHFTPEPNSAMLAGGALLGLAAILTRRARRARG